MFKEGGWGKQQLKRNGGIGPICDLLVTRRALCLQWGTGRAEDDVVTGKNGNTTLIVLTHLT